MSARFTTSVESYAHRSAKDVLATWLRECGAEVGYDGLATLGDLAWRVNLGAPSFGIWTEFPILRDGTGAIRVWDEIDDRWLRAPPTFDGVVALGYRPAAILDVAIQHKGQIAYGIEIKHKHGCDARRAAFLRQWMGVVEIPSAWVLGQVCRPTDIPEDFFL